MTDRIITSDEVFTPDNLVQEMLNHPDIMNIILKNGTFCDPACGDGQFIIAIIKAKLEAGYSPVESVKTTYGVELYQDNVDACKYRIRKLIVEYTNRECCGHVKKLINENIVCANALIWDFVAWQSTVIDKTNTLFEF